MSENKNSAAKIAANNRYSEKKYDRINLVIPKGKKEEIKNLSEQLGYPSINKFVNTAIDEKIEREVKSN